MYAELIRLIEDVAKRVVRDASLPVEYGAVTDDLVSGADIKVKPDSMNIELSYTLGSLTIADNLILRKGDRVVLVGVNTGQDYHVLSRISKDPTKVTFGSGQKVLALVGNAVQILDSENQPTTLKGIIVATPEEESKVMGE